MSKYVVVPEAPVELKDGEFVITVPDFLEQIQENKSKAPRGSLTAVNHLRHIVGSIGQKYDQNLNVYTVKPQNFIGRRYGSDQDLSKIVVEMLRAQYPSIFGSYVDYQIKHRPKNTQLIYFVGTIGTTDIPFQLNGIDKMTDNEYAAYAGKVAKRTVGKPAITKADAEAKKNEEQN